MNHERPTIEMIAPTAEEAVERGLAELRLTRDQVDITLLDEGAPGERDARVRITAKRSPGAADETPAQRAAREFLEELLARLKIRARVSAHWGEQQETDRARPLVLDVRGDDLGQLIGRHGETLTAIQYLTRVVTAKQIGEYVNVVVDVEGYRSRREQQLRRLAQRMAEQAVAQRRTVVLEPMPANERLIIHMALRDHPDVYTQSTGEGEHRKVTIVPKS